MSTSAAPRGTRGSSRARGSSRGNARRELRNAASSGQGSRSSSPIEVSRRGGSTQQSTRASTRVSQPRNGNTWRTPTPNQQQLKSAILDHAGNRGQLPTQESWRNADQGDTGSYKNRMNDLYQRLKENRERERKQAIKDGFLADPDKPTSLANAITPVGTCQEMCPEFERVERIVQIMVDANEKIPSTTDPEKKVPCEDLMVKRFRRSAAGYDEQLPSDIRPPAVLQKTLDHLFESVIGGSEPLAFTHKFVWDRTRGIRNDFSIQQVTKVADLRIAIECFEKIARFHILSLHQLSRDDADNGEFDHFQEREQLNNTLLSLTYYYDDSRHKMVSPNEAEFRAYCVIFEIQDQRPDLEDRAQNWPSQILKDRRVRTALKLYAAAGNISDEQGPLRPRTTFPTAQSNTRGFFELIKSNAVSYTMACVAEIYFNLIRKRALEAIWKVYKGKRPVSAKVEDWLTQDLMQALGFDNEEQTWAFCEEHGFEILEREDGEYYINLGAVTDRNFEDTNPRRKQLFSRSLVEHKRFGRSLPAVIHGFSVAQARSQGLVHDSELDDASVADSESLFIHGGSDDEKRSSAVYDKGKIESKLAAPQISLDPQTNNAPTNTLSTFGLPSSKTNPFQPTSTFPTPQETGGLSVNQPSTTNSIATNKPPRFNFFPSAGQENTRSMDNPPTVETTTPTFQFTLASDAESKPESSFSIFKPFGVSSEPSSQGISGKPSDLKRSDEYVSNSKPFFGTHSQVFGTSPSNMAPKKTDREVVQKTQNLEQEKESNSHFPFVGSPTAQPRANKPQKPPLSMFTNSNPSEEMQSASYSPSKNLTEKVQEPSTSFSSQTRSSIGNILHEIQLGPHDILPQSTSNPSVLPESDNNHPRTLQAQVNKPSFGSSVQFPLMKNTSTTAPSRPSPLHQTLGASMPQDQNLENNKFMSQATSKPSAATRNQHKIPDPRPEAIEKIAEALVLEEGGLLQQYIEITVGPIVRRVARQFEDERSWQQARSYRVLLLARKYGRLWKANVWKLGLARRAKQRRQNFARSVQVTPNEQHQEPENTIWKSLRKILIRPKKNPTRFDKSIVKTPVEEAQERRRSLPSQFKVETNELLRAPNDVKRKREQSDDPVEVSGLKSRKMVTHNRSSTIDESTLMNPSQRLFRRPLRSNFERENLRGDSLLDNTVGKQAKHLSPMARSGATQTDYFRLKALGIDPDTPAVPFTEPRSNSEAGASKNGKASRRLVESSPVSNQDRTKKSTQATAAPTSHPNVRGGGDDDDDDDDDEAFFASIRSIRDTLADSTSWFQNERATLERSMTPHAHSQVSKSPVRKETPAESRLREIKERGSMPSRSEIRLRAMGDRAILPPGFWDGEGMGTSLYGKGRKGEHDVEEEDEDEDEDDEEQEEEEEEEEEEEGEEEEEEDDEEEMDSEEDAPTMGFAAMADHSAAKPLVNGHNGYASQLHQSGASMEDAIEL